MDDRSLLKLCLFCSVLGLVILFFGIQQIEAKIIGIENINQEEVGRLVSVQGTVESRYYNGQHLFFTIKDGTGKIKVVIFENMFSRLGLEPSEIEKGMNLRIEGEVKKYEGELEIIPERVYM